jgi:hypothetical protein
LNLRKFLKEYYGLIPVVGGTIIAGAVGVVAYSVGLAQDFSKEVQYISSTNDVIGGVFTLYNNASAVCGRYIMPGFLAGQFLTYKFKKSLTSFFK